MQSLKYKELEKILNNYGFYYVRSKGSHNIFKRDSDGSTFAIPYKGKKVNGVLLAQFKRRFILCNGQKYF